MSSNNIKGSRSILGNYHVIMETNGYEVQSPKCQSKRMKLRHTTNDCEVKDIMEIDITQDTKQHDKHHLIENGQLPLENNNKNFIENDGLPLEDNKDLIGDEEVPLENDKELIEDEEVPLEDDEDNDDTVLPEGVYEVEEIMDYVNGSYLVKWIGWASEHNTWESITNLTSCKDALVAFYMKRKSEISNNLLMKTNSISNNCDVGDSMRKRKKGIKEFQLPPDPRPIELMAEEYYDRMGHPTSNDRKEIEKMWMEDLKAQFHNTKKKKSTILSRWNRTKVVKMLEDALESTDNSKEVNLILERQVVVHILDDRRQQALNDLKEWEKELNEVSDNRPMIKVENEVDWEGPPSHFTYINDYRPGKDVVIPDDPVFGCSCGICYDDRTNCSKAHNDLFPYSQCKRIRVPVGTPIYECNRLCSCSSECPNRVVQDGRENLIKFKLCIFRTSNGCGWGVKTLKNIKKGTFVSLYLGEVITSDEAERRGRAYDDNGCTYLFDLDINGRDNPYSVDAASYGNISHFMNHSCDPNLAVYSVFVNCVDPNLPKLALFTTRDVHYGDELCFDYSGREDDEIRNDKDRESKYQHCLCGSTKCRKYFF